MTLQQERLQAKLAPRTVRYYAQVGSTNDIALAWLQMGAAAGDVVIADEQQRGRGRLGRTWHTPPGVALALSVILCPEQAALSRVSILGAVAIAELCEHLGLDAVGIKWPNDVQIGGRKVSGVLPEVVWDGDTLQGVVLGMGINVRTDFSLIGLENTAVNIEEALGQAVDRTDLLVFLLARIDFWAARIDSDALLDAWTNRLTTLGQQVSYEAITGTAEAVDALGALLVRQDDGTLYRVVAGDIVLGSSQARQE